MEGRKLSKRDGVTSISGSKQMGFMAEALVNWLLSWAGPRRTQPFQEIFTLAEAAR